MSKFHHSTLVVLPQSDNFIAGPDCTLPALPPLDRATLDGGLSIFPSFNCEGGLIDFHHEIRQKLLEQGNGSVSGDVPVEHRLPLWFFDPGTSVDFVGFASELQLNPGEQRSVAVVDVEDEIVADVVLLPLQFNRPLSINDTRHVRKFCTHTSEYTGSVS